MNRVTRKVLDDLLVFVAREISREVGYEPGNIYLEGYRPGTEILYGIFEVTKYGGQRPFIIPIRLNGHDMKLALETILNTTDAIQQGRAVVVEPRR